MVSDFIYYDDDGNLVYADPSDSQNIFEQPDELFDDFKLFRKKINENTYEHYDELIFIDKLEKIITQHPFIDIRSFIHDYLSGLSGFKILTLKRVNRFFFFSFSLLISQYNLNSKKAKPAHFWLF